MLRAYRRALVALPCLVAFCGVPAVAHAADAVVTCAFDAGRVSVEIANPSGPPVLVGRLPSGEIHAGDVGCGATVAATDVVAVHVSSGDAGLDLAEPLGPGLTPEPGELAEIEVEWSGAGALVLSGGAGEDDFRYAAAGLHLNGDPDVDLTFAAAPAELRLAGGDGDDLLDASGAPAATDVVVDAGAGNDIVHGHPGPDVIDGGAGDDRIDDGAGADVVTAGDGDDVVAAMATYSWETATPVPVPDNGRATSTLTMPASMLEYDVEVRVTLAHTDVSRVDIQIDHGEVSGLVHGAGEPGTAYAGAVFHDSGGRIAVEAQGVRTGRFRPPTFPLRRTAFLLGSRRLTWTLSVFDNAADGQSGTILGWSVHVVGRPGSWASTGPSADAADSYDGGAGQDTLSYATRSGPMTFGAGVEWGAGGEAGEGDAVRYPTFESYDGGFGDDVFTGSPRDEAFHGGHGADTIRGNGGSDVYDCGYSYPVNDVATFSEAPVALDIDLANGVVTGDGTDTISDCETVYGTPRGDTITGSGANEVLWGLGGGDRMASGDGRDELHGGEGDDLFLEGDGWGPDVIDGAEGVDRVSYAGRGGWRVRVTFNGVADDGVVYPREDDNLLGVENATGGDGDDVFIGDGLANDFDAGAGDDWVEGGGGDDWLYGGAGKDRIIGGAGNDRVFGQGGDDVFYEDRAANGADDVSGGPGYDLADYGGRALPLVIDLDDAADDGQLGEGDNVRFDVEILWGGAGPDLLTGNWARNQLYGFGGADVLTGGPDADLLDGGLDNDVLLAQDLVADLLLGGDGVDSAQGDAKDETKSVEVFSPY